MRLIYLAEQKIHLKWIIDHDRLSTNERADLGTLLQEVDWEIDRVCDQRQKGAKKT